MKTNNKYLTTTIDVIRILGNELDLPCNWGSCGGIFSNANDMDLFL